MSGNWQTPSTCQPPAGPDVPEHPVLAVPVTGRDAIISHQKQLPVTRAFPLGVGEFTPTFSQLPWIFQPVTACPSGTNYYLKHQHSLRAHCQSGWMESQFPKCTTILAGQPQVCLQPLLAVCILYLSVPKCTPQGDQPETGAFLGVKGFAVETKSYRHT